MEVMLEVRFSNLQVIKQVGKNRNYYLVFSPCHSSIDFPTASKAVDYVAELCYYWMYPHLVSNC